MMRQCLMRAAAAAGAFASSPAIAETDRGLHFGAHYTSDSFANFGGGRKTGFSTMGLLDLTAEAKGSVIGIHGLEAFASVQYLHGRSLSGNLVGDTQVSSNIDAPDGLRLFEAWVSVPVAKNGYVKAGLIDVHSALTYRMSTRFSPIPRTASGPISRRVASTARPSSRPHRPASFAGVTTGQVTLRAGLLDAVSSDPERPGRTVVRFPGENGLLAIAEAEIGVADEAQLQLGA
jgi:porin